MSRKILKSNGAFVLIGDSPSWKTTNETGRLLSLVQNVNFGLANERQQLKQIGNQAYSVNHINRSPNVNLTIDYYLSPYLNNEFLLGFAGKTSYEQNFLEKTFYGNFSDNNFYIVIDNTDGKDAISEARKKSPQTINFSGYDVLSFGNCYLTNYQLAFSLGSIPTVSTSYSCSNMKIDDLTGNLLTIPAINHQSGNAINAGSLNLGASTYPILSGHIDSKSQLNFDISNLPVTTSRNSTFTLQNLQVGGIPLSKSSDPILQNLNINLDFNRTDLYGLGSNYVYDRKLNYPVMGTIEIEALVSGFNSGFMSGIVNNENDYSFEIQFTNPTNVAATGLYRFSRAKLESFNYSMAVNNIMSFNASFSVEILSNTGFSIGRYIQSGDNWAVIQEIWQSFDINWQ
jgi:hypothetical protein